MHKVQVFSTATALGIAAATQIAELAAQAVRRRGRFAVALSGGSLPQIVCPPLVAEPLRQQIDWSAWHVFWADERCVPLTHPDSNYALARAQLFDHVPIPAKQIYPLDEGLDAGAAASAYTAKLRQVFEPSAGELPQFDLILLGMGPDGHIASLFPHHPLLQEQMQWVAPIYDSPKPPPQRITFTLPVISQARTIFFIVTGANKKEKFRAAQQGPSLDTPASLVQPSSGEVHWYVDAAAAGQG